jgi:hypothetical protein
LQEARQHVGGSGWREWHDDADRPIGAELRGRRARVQKRGGTKRKKKSSAPNMFPSPLWGGVRGGGGKVWP